MKLEWTQEPYRVEQVRAHKRVLSGHLSQREIASAIGVSVETLRGYAKDPSAGNWRPIPEIKLRLLRDLAIAKIENTLEVYRAAA